MSDSIFLLRPDSSEPVELREYLYDSEDLLQKLIANHPDVIAGDQLNPDSPRRWLLVEREQGVPDQKDGTRRWSLDHLFLDQDAIPTLIEVKRSTDTRIRREVVGQMLDYAANAVVYWPIEEIRERFNSRCESDGESPDELIANLLRVDIDDEGVSDRFWQQTKTNLQAGRIRLIFAADMIPRELRRIIEFLNSQMDPAEVVGVELKQFKDDGGDFRILVPKVSGLTAEAERKKTRSSSPGKKTISREDFVEVARQNCNAGGLKTVEAVVKWCDSHCFDAACGQGSRSTSFIPSIPVGTELAHPISLWATPELWFQMKYIRKTPPFDKPEKREELRLKLSPIPGWKILDAGMEGFPSIKLNEVRSDDDRSSLLAALDWVVEQVQGREQK